MSKILAKFKNFTMKTENIFIISVLIAALSLMGAISYYNNNELKSMERNIDSAIAKGIDPLAVKCAYKSDSTLCTLYAARK